MRGEPQDFEVEPEWERLPGTHVGSYYRIERDVILAVPQPGFRQEREHAQASLAALDAIAHEAGRRQCVIVLVDRVASQDAAARRVWSEPRADESRCGLALVTRTLLGRAIGSFFLGLNRAPVPTHMFPDLESARAWAKQMVETHGGPF